MYGQITNPSKTQVMKATLSPNFPGDKEKSFFIKPQYIMPVAGEVIWERWTFTWLPKPRKGLMRFTR